MNTWQQFFECPSKYPLLSLTMGFYGRTQGNKCIKMVDSYGQMEQLHRHPVILNFVPDCTLLMQFTTDCLCPFQLRHLTLSLSFKGIKLVGKVTSFLMCSPKNSVNRLFLHCVSAGCCAHVACTFVSTFYLRVVRGCPASFIAGIKHVGGGKQEIAFHTTGLGWTFQ